MKLQGIFPPITTPFDHAGNLYATKVQHNIEKWNLTTLAGYVVCGSTGETPFLAAEERYTLWELVAKYAAPEKLLIAGTGVDGVLPTVCLTNRAADFGYKAALVLTPHYFKNQMNRPETQLLYFRSVADRVKIPVLIYNFPQMTGVDIAADTVVRLSEHPNIIGMKDSSGNIEKMMHVVREAKPGFQTLVGSAQVLWPALLMGAAGGILAFSNAAPYSTIAIWEAFRTREEEAARDWQGRVSRAASVTGKYGIPGLKHAMDLNGYYGGPPRLPWPGLGRAEKLEIERAFTDLKS
jgi:dihydrodipicolinate synthase/N-acetylneuraminate lyase